MDSECQQLLPSVCAVLADPRQPVSDDTCLEKLLDWFRGITETDSGASVLQENPCLVDLILQGLTLEEPNPSLLGFILRLAGLFAASERGFQRLSEGELLLSLFGQNLSTSRLWEDATVRSGWIQGVHSMVQHVSAVQFLYDCGSMNLILTLQKDTSLFIASSANELIVHILGFSILSAIQQPLSTSGSNWPASAQLIVAHLNRSLRSSVPSQVAQSLKALITVFRGCHDTWTGVLWSSFVQPVESLLKQEPVCEASLLVELFLSMARSPIFSHHESELWGLLINAMQRLDPLQASSLSLGILKLRNCPQVVSIPALRVLLQPMDCILRATTDHPDQPGMLELVSDSKAVETLLSIKSSCIGLLCQTLAHLEALQCLDFFPLELPHEPLLHCILTILEFCIGLSNPSSSLGNRISRFLVGSLRVQRLSLDVLGAVSHWTISSVSLGKIFDVLLVYLKSPDTKPTILKKSFQATLKWLLSCSKLTNLKDMSHTRNKFLRDLLPLLQKRFSSPCWEVRDSTLEFLAHLVDCCPGMVYHRTAHSFTDQDELRQILQSSAVTKPVWDLLKDSESYVRASAVITLGRLAVIGSLNQTLPGPARTNNQQNVISKLLEILGEDTESFPRRAVIRVVTDWFREGHLELLGDLDQLISRVFELANCDLDWEVKLHGLELAEIFISRTAGNSNLSLCPYAVVLSSTPESSLLEKSLQKFCQVKLFEFLLSALCDCDRPVAQKSCDILISLKRTLCVKEVLIKGPVAQKSQRTDWLEESLRSWRSCCKDQPDQDCTAGPQQKPEWALGILEAVDLDGLQVALDKSSDHMEKSPRSLLQDILATAGTLAENGVDCY
ncbi:integrator complex assembly factor BRAT1 isoform X2 [Microcaecilia unicolor]|uniref:BRCA1-associated ATM activator 1 isoform X2 n=1 Tax=Microcaecilia unicolor TaxID=1415580 RepID=A0A6P7YV62_9AMPH|nr:BRCA1-associated ATM activator 1 isoform X2 [Microcaecilia unicolor]